MGTNWRPTPLPGNRPLTIAETIRARENVIQRIVAEHMAWWTPPCRMESLPAVKKFGRDDGFIVIPYGAFPILGPRIETQ